MRTQWMMVLVLMSLLAGCGEANGQSSWREWDLDETQRQFFEAFETEDLPALMEMFAEEVTIYGLSSGMPSWDSVTYDKSNGFDGFLNQEGFLYWVMFDTEAMFDYISNSGEIFPGFLGISPAERLASLKGLLPKVERIYISPSGALTMCIPYAQISETRFQYDTLTIRFDQNTGSIVSIGFGSLTI